MESKKPSEQVNSDKRIRSKQPPTTISTSKMDAWLLLRRQEYLITNRRASIAANLLQHVRNMKSVEFIIIENELSKFSLILYTYLLDCQACFYNHKKRAANQSKLSERKSEECNEKPKKQFIRKFPKEREMSIGKNDQQKQTAGTVHPHHNYIFPKHV